MSLSPTLALHLWGFFIHKYLEQTLFIFVEEIPLQIITTNNIDYMLFQGKFFQRLITKLTPPMVANDDQWVKTAYEG